MAPGAALWHPRDGSGTDMQLIRILALVFSLVAWATPSAAETIIVRAGRLIDVVQGRVLTNQAVRIEDGRISAVGDFPSQPPADVRVVDWSAYTVAPGLMDMHSHLDGDINS